MSKRYTIRDLRSDIDELNQRLEKAGAYVRYRVKSRNGYNGVDLYSIEDPGVDIYCVDCAEPARELNRRMQEDALNYL